MEALELLRASGAKMSIHMALLVVASVYMRIEQSERAARLIGAARTLMDTMGIPFPQTYAAVYAGFNRALLRRLGAEAFALHTEIGTRLTVDEAITDALDA